MLLGTCSTLMASESWSSSKRRGTGKDQPTHSSMAKVYPTHPSPSLDPDLLGMPTALTARSPPGQPPASWPTSGNTASSTVTSGRYVLQRPVNRVSGHEAQYRMQVTRRRDTSLELRGKGPRLCPEHYGEGRVSGIAKAVLIFLSSLRCRKATGKRTSWAHR